MDRLVKVSIERDSAEIPGRAQIFFHPMPLNFFFRTYDILGPRPMNLDELEKQVQQDVCHFIAREIAGAFNTLRKELPPPPEKE